jgi:hypothetical protein
MIATAPRPLQIIHAKAMHQDKNLLAGPRDGGSEIAGIERNRVAVAAQTHGYGERVLSGGKMIAQNPVHGRQHRFPFRRSLRFGAHFDKRSNDGFHTVGDELRDAAHRRVSCAHHASKQVPGIVLCIASTTVIIPAVASIPNRLKPKISAGLMERTKFPSAASIVYCARNGERRQAPIASSPVCRFRPVLRIG